MQFGNEEAMPGPQPHAPEQYAPNVAATDEFKRPPAHTDAEDQDSDPKRVKKRVFEIKAFHFSISSTATSRFSFTESNAASANARALNPSSPVVGGDTFSATDLTKAAISFA